MRKPIHPGETLSEDLEALGTSAAVLARRIEVPVNRFTEILNGRCSITCDTALCLGHFFGASGSSGSTLRNSTSCGSRRGRTARLPTLDADGGLRATMNTVRTQDATQMQLDRRESKVWRRCRSALTLLDGQARAPSAMGAATSSRRGAEGAMPGQGEARDAIAGDQVLAEGRRRRLDHRRTRAASRRGEAVAMRIDYFKGNRERVR
ncbi:MAG: HigA family addiction module antitoxin [Albidovulum sp.]|nr:HigA family addiction module antitoxin [Albidovulum sp.]